MLRETKINSSRKTRHETKHAPKNAVSFCPFAFSLAAGVAYFSDVSDVADFYPDMRQIICN